MIEASVIRRTFGGVQTLLVLVAGAVGCGGSIDAESREHGDAAPDPPADAAPPERDPEDVPPSCRALGEGVELVAADLRGVNAIDANAGSITLTVSSYPVNPAVYELIMVSKSTCAEHTLATSTDPINDITATDRLVFWSVPDRVLYAEAPAWTPVPFDARALLASQNQIYAYLHANDHDDVPIARLGIEADPFRTVLAGLNRDRVDVLADLSGIDCQVQDIARHADSFFLAGGVVVLDVGPRGCVALASNTGEGRLIFETEQFLPLQIVAHAGLAYFTTGDSIWALEPASGAPTVFVAEPAEAIAGDATGIYWAGNGRLRYMPWSGSPSRTLATITQTDPMRFVAVDDQHVYWLERTDDPRAPGVSYNLLRVIK